MESKENYNKVIKEINDNTIVLFRLFCMKLTKCGEEWRKSDNYYISSD